MAQVVDQISDLKSPAGLDSKAEILVDPDAEYPLHRIEFGNPGWQPSAQRLAKANDEGDFPKSQARSIAPSLRMTGSQGCESLLLGALVPLVAMSNSSTGNFR
jgi:hypothetical protein